MNKELLKVIKLLDSTGIEKYNCYSVQGINYKLNEYSLLYNDFIIEGLLINVDPYIRTNSTCYDILRNIEKQLKRYKNIVVKQYTNHSIIIYNKFDYIAWDLLVLEDQKRIDNFNLWRHDLIEKYGVKNVCA